MTGSAGFMDEAGNPGARLSSAMRSMDRVDNMPPGLRACVHEFGLPIVDAFLANEIRSPARIRRLVHSCWCGARSVTQRNAKEGYQRNLDWLLLQAGAAISAETLVAFLRQQGLVIVPMEPTTQMVEASMDAVKSMGSVNKEQKHRGRLRVALAVAGRMFGGDS